MILMPFLGFGQPGAVALWCENRGYVLEGRFKGWLEIWVINGHWTGYWKDDQVHIDVTRDTIPARLVWQGNSYHEAQDYNEAIHFINQTYWSEDMTTERTNFDAVLNAQDVAEHNNNVTVLATAYRNQQQVVDSLEER